MLRRLFLPEVLDVGCWMLDVGCWMLDLISIQLRCEADTDELI